MRRMPNVFAGASFGPTRETGAHDYYQFRTPGANLCLNVRGNGTANNTRLIIYTCTSGGVANDLFTWIPARQ